MELQQLLLSRDYLQRAAAAGASPGFDTAAAATTSRSCSVVAGLTAVDCHRSSLHDVLLRHRRPMMQYPAESQHRAAAAAAAAAIGLGPAAAPSPYCGPYYQRPSTSAQHYLSAPSHHRFPDTSRQAPSMSYDQQAALLRDTATRLAVVDNVHHQMSELGTPSRSEMPALGVNELANYCTDRRCSAADCMSPVAPLAFNLPPSSYCMSASRQLYPDSASAAGAVSGSGGAGAGAFKWYLRPPVATNINYATGDCVCQWLESTAGGFNQHVKLKVTSCGQLLVLSNFYSPLNGRSTHINTKTI